MDTAEILSELFGVETPEEAFEILENQAVKENGNYSVELDEQEKAELEKEITELSLKIKEKEEELSYFKKYMKKQIDPLKDARNEKLIVFKDGIKTVNGVLYKLVDINAKQVYYISDQLILVTKRPMTPADGQMELFK